MVRPRSLGGFPGILLRKIQAESTLEPAVFIDFLIQVRQILLEQAAGQVVVKGLRASVPSSTYTVPRVSDNSCDVCIHSKVPCVQVVESTMCLSCFLKRRAHCNQSDNGRCSFRSRFSMG